MNPRFIRCSNKKNVIVEVLLKKQRTKDELESFSCCFYKRQTNCKLSRITISHKNWSRLSSISLCKNGQNIPDPKRQANTIARMYSRASRHDIKFILFYFSLFVLSRKKKLLFCILEIHVSQCDHGMHW